VTAGTAAGRVVRFVKLCRSERIAPVIDRAAVTLSDNAIGIHGRYSVAAPWLFLREVNPHDSDG
jgi:hypothetical protein